MPTHLRNDPLGIQKFCIDIVDATADTVCAFKPQIAYFAAVGAEAQLQAVCDHVRTQYPHIVLILDAKRGDIGNTSSMYARAFFKHMDFDAITVAPYMGEDSLSPFFQFEGKWVICLGLTSNAGSKDFQILKVGETPLYLEVMRKVSQWGTNEQLMFVTGATKASDLKALRVEFPQHFFLVPGVGAQGGTVKEVCDNALTDFGGLLINASRSILYASSGTDYIEKASAEAQKLQEECQTAMGL